MPAVEPLVIVGAGGFGREVAALVEDINAASPRWELLGFADDAAALQGQLVQGLPVLGTLEWLARQRGLSYTLAIGAARTRARAGFLLQAAPHQAATLLHPTASAHRTSEIGPGAILCRGTTVTVGVTLGRHVLLNLHCTVGHDARLADYTTAYPGVHLSGGVSTGTAVELGTGCVVLPGVRVGDEAIVGAGAVVHRDLPERCTAVGVPARPLPR